ncbi:Ger(x)C family spore germination protein [Halanaerocella petrolearia]
MNKKIKAIVLLSCVLINLVGCAGKREVDQLGIVNLTSIDRSKKTGNYEISVQIVSPQRAGGGQAETQVWVVTATGDTVMQASKNLRARTSKSLVWFHSNLILIGEEVAREGLREVIDFFARNQEIRYNSWVLVTKDRADNIMEIAPRFQGSLAQEIIGILENAKDWSNAYALNLKDMLMRLADKKLDEVTARVTYYEPFISPEGTYKQEDLVKQLSENDKRIVAVDTMAIFKDGKLQGWFTKEQSRGYLWITGEMKEGTLVVDTNKNREEQLSVDIINAQSSLKPEVIGDRVKFKLEVKAAAAITEQKTSLDLTKSKNIIKAQKMISEEIKDSIEAALEKAQRDYKADVFGYSGAVYRNEPDKWQQLKKNWDQIFPTVKTDIKVNVTIKRLGVISKPILEE